MNYTKFRSFWITVTCASLVGIYLSWKQKGIKENYIKYYQPNIIDIDKQFMKSINHLYDPTNASAEIRFDLKLLQNKDNNNESLIYDDKTFVSIGGTYYRLMRNRDEIYLTSATSVYLPTFDTTSKQIEYSDITGMITYDDKPLRFYNVYNGNIYENGIGLTGQIVEDNDNIQSFSHELGLKFINENRLRSSNLNIKS